jgi:DNA modification methylase
MTVRIINADVMDGLKQLADNSVHCVVTSPPYFGLRSYLPPDHPLKHLEIGSEPTLQEHIAKLVGVFREVRRVLRKDGTLWLNYGDMWCSTDKWGGGGKNRGKQTLADDGSVPSWAVRAKKPKQKGLKPKDLCMVPHRLAIALQDDGWWVRSDIVWHKPNAMPSSVTDRPSAAKEYVFLLTKGARYHYNAEAVAEPRTSDEDAKTFRGGSYVAGQPGPRVVQGNKRIGKNERAVSAMCEASASPRAGFNERWENAEAAGADAATRNCRDVWTIATEAFPEAHYATFPARLAERCMLAGCPAGGTVLDPFGGSGTVGLVADRLQINAVLIDLNPENETMAERRIARDRLQRGNLTMDNVKAARLAPTPLEALMEATP